MITINNKKNSDINPGNANLNESVLSTMIQKTDDGLKFLDKNAEKIQPKLEPLGKYSDLIAGGATMLDKGISSLTKDRRSIIARAKNSVLQFPIYMVNTINISAAHTVSKTFERVYASFVQSVLAQYPIVDEDSINDLAFLKQFHTNLNESTNFLFNEYYEPIDDFDQIMQESISNTIMCENGVIARFNVTPSDNVYLNNESARLINEPLVGFENFFIESDVANTRKREGSKENNTAVEEKNGLNVNEVEKLFDKEKPELPVEPTFPKKPTKEVGEAPADYDARVKDWEDKNDDLRDEYIVSRDKYKKDINQYEADFAKFIPSIKDGTKTVYSNGSKVQYDKDTDTFFIMKAGRVVNKSDVKQGNVEFKAPVMLRDSDIKKLNGMLPYTFDANFTIKGTGGSNAGNIVHYIIGVKSVLHLIQPKDLSNELQELITGDIKNLQKVRYKTGEISFWKDYIFRKDALKADASKHIDGSKRWVNTLKHLADFNKQHGGMFDKPASVIAGGDIPIPNGTLVLTQPDVLRMKSDTGIDLEDVGMAKKLARNLFLISVVILDSSAGSMKVLFTDSDATWDVQSLASIEAEVSRTDNSNLVKELNRIINK